MRKVLLSIIILFCTFFNLIAGGEPSTYFNIYVPPNNDAVRRDVALIVTAINDSTYFSINDDGADGDTDDTVSGWLMAGQSYILYIRDNGINDDARYASGGELKSDGDYFTIESSKLVYASMSTNSDWQHDFVASVNKKSVGSKFIIYSPATSFSNRDLNVFAYEDDTRVTISKISNSATNQTGYTDVDINNSQIVAQQTLDIGQDIIHFFTDGRDIMASGETFLIESNKDISVQYGALWTNARDGGGYVPSANGSSSGELFYFAVPYQAGGEQEIRIVSWDDDNDVVLERYVNGSWVEINNWNLNTYNPADWVGKQNGNVTYNTVFRVTCSIGKRVSVFEANWMETGSIGTSDMATMLSSANGTTSGTEFLAYIAPPGNEQNVVDPFTGNKIGQSLTHLYLFASTTQATVNVVDAKTQGQVFNKTFAVDAERYADVQITANEWKSIYNGTGTNSGSDRPYLFISSNQNIAVLNTNFNDNWMTYFGSSLPHAFKLSANETTNSAIPGDTLRLSSKIVIEGNSTLENANLTVKVGSGAVPVSSVLSNNTDGTSISGDISISDNNSIISFQDVPDIKATDDYEVVTELVLSTAYNNGELIEDNTVITVENILSGEIDNYQQESIITQGIQNNSSNASLLLMNDCSSELFDNTLTNSWNSVWLDYNNDGWDDLFLTDKNENSPNRLYKNESGSLTEVTSGQPVLNSLSKTVSAIAADINNDGWEDLFIVNATNANSSIYLSNNGIFSELENSGLSIHPEYFHGASFADFNNDGYVDLLVTNFFITKFHQLYKNNGDNTFTLITENEIAITSARSTAPVLADYDHDGLIDVFIPNGDSKPNSLFKNLGNFQFTAVTNEITTEAKNSVSAAWGDYDNDGDLDLFVGNASAQNNDFYVNNGDGSFTKLDITTITNNGGHSHGAKWVDLNNDTHLDLLVNNDQGRNFVYLNNGTGNFILKNDEIISADFGNAYGMAISDYNHDGMQDAFISTHGNEANKLFCGNSNDNHWIAFKLEGVISNASAIGAKLYLKAGGNWYYKELLPVSGFGSQSSLIQHFGLAENTVVDSLKVEWPSGITQHITTGLIVDATNVITEEAQVTLKLISFHDQNGNSVQDASEAGIENIRITVSNQTNYVVSGPNGETFVNLEAGNYDISLAPNDYWQLANSINQPLDGSEEFLTVYLPLEAKQLGNDVSINVVQTPWRRGFKNSTIVQVKNEGTTTAYPTDITLNYPDGVYIVDSERAYAEFGADYVFTVDSLAPGEIISFSLMDSVGLETVVGEFLAFEAHVYLETQDLNPANNSIYANIEIVGAIDPNDIVVSPRGEGTDGWVSADQWLTYTIRFQNVGSYYATHVFLESEIDEDLDINALELISSSHPVSVKLVGDSLKAAFYNIMLMDSSTNEVESHGYLQYRIKPTSRFNGGEPIYNQAAIIFDYEAPVITNKLRNTIKYDGNGSIGRLNVYPNPADNYCIINTDMDYIKYNEGEFLKSYSIKDIYGNEIRKGDFEPIKEATLQLENIPSGMYFIEAKELSGKRYVAKILIN
ncbi:hypothetical protein GCM10027429_20830 [Marivirga atlantica]|jgi:hypothetical protein|uniref:VCBS repeat-containing protein n=1 Tax=Marivirga atlantica TaxID=1548457 RepID=A0A937A8S8_9BACT|nr:FG-GAP-like repeat-containing protein [Marivirga atlantica]MBL0765700.1 VCBS repeat-containing protein [Marivirga atlantica]